MKKQNGITLVALVITIIVLLILAGVSLSLAIGEHGILGQAKNTKAENEKATALEEIKFAISEAEIAYYEAYNKNSSVGKGHFFGDGTYFERACKSAKKLESGKPNVYVTKGDGVENKSNEGLITVTYTGESGTVYTATFNLEEPSKITFTP